MIAILRQVAEDLRVRPDDSHDWENDFSVMIAEDAKNTKPKVIVAHITDTSDSSASGKDVETHQTRKRKSVKSVLTAVPPLKKRKTESHDIAVSSNLPDLPK